MTKDVVDEEVSFEDANEVATQLLSDIMDECARRKMRPPFIITAVSRNGSVLSIRAMYDGSDPDTLAEHYEPEGFSLPINMIVVDQTDQGLWASVEGKQITYH